MHAHVEDFHFFVHKRLDVMTIIEHCHSSNVGNMNRSLIFFFFAAGINTFFGQQETRLLT